MNIILYEDYTDSAAQFDSWYLMGDTCGDGIALEE